MEELMQEGWIKLHRKTIDSEWFTDVNTSHLFIYCLLKANHESKTWQGIVIERGQLITSLPMLAQNTGLSIQNVRTSLKRLKSTGNLTDKTYSKYRLISITNYDSYQSSNSQANSHLTGIQQASNRHLTANKNEKNYKNEKKEYIMFEEFWNLYNNKKNKDKCLKKYEKLIQTGTNHQEVMDGVKKYLEYLKVEDWLQQKHPMTFLNNKSWEDDYTIKKPDLDKDEEYYQRLLKQK